MHIHVTRLKDTYVKSDKPEIVGMALLIPPCWIWRTNWKAEDEAVAAKKSNGDLNKKNSSRA
jgi:hypothetical protein